MLHGELTMLPQAPVLISQHKVHTRVTVPTKARILLVSFLYCDHVLYR